MNIYLQFLISNIKELVENWKNYYKTDVNEIIQEEPQGCWDQRS